MYVSVYVWVLAAQSCPTLCDPMECIPQVLLSIPFFRKEYWSGLPFPSPGDLPNPGIEPGLPVLQTDSLPSEPPGKAAAREGALPSLLRNCSKEVRMAAGVSMYVLLVKGEFMQSSRYFSRRFSASFVNLSASHEEQFITMKGFCAFLDMRSKNSAH